MPKSRRSFRFTVVNGFVLIAIVSGLVLAATAGASPRFGFIRSVGEFFGMASTTGPTGNLAPTDQGAAAESRAPDLMAILAFSQQGGKLVGTGNTGAAQQGYSVSVSADGNTAIVGGYTDNSNQGAAWVCAMAAPPTLGTYPATSIVLSDNATIAPVGNVAPTGTTSISVSAPTSFISKLNANPTTGVMRVTNAALGKIPPGAYPVTVRAFGPGGTAPANFNLTVNPPPPCGGLSFNSAVNFAAGDGPRSVAVGDFNGDGNQDLAVPNSNTGSVSVLLGNGAGSFGGAVSFNVGSIPNSVAVGDFNGDGNQDLAAVNSNSDTVSVLLGNGAGAFAAAANFSVGENPVSIAVGDFNGDGNQDVATANGGATNNVSVLLGNGAGSFAAAVGFAVGITPLSVVVGDFDGDGDQDLATANNNSGNISVLLGNGDGTFAAAANFAVPFPSSLAIGDFDGDGDQDLAVANDASSISVLIGNGNGSFGAATAFAAGDQPSSVAVGDFNGDGKQDLAGVNTNSNNVSILLGNGSGSFTAGPTLGVGSTPLSIAIGDFNGDGSQDLVTANFNSDNVSILRRTCTLPPTVTSVNPNSGSTAGGNSVTITGTNFTGATAVNFGGTAVTNLMVISPTEITVTAPAHAAGAVSVEVTTPGGTNAANMLYTYVAPPTYTVMYAGNGNTGGTAPVDPNSPYSEGTWVGVLGTGDLVNTGFGFGGWNTMANGSGTRYAPGQIFAPVADTVLYAQWILEPCFTGGSLDTTFNGTGKVTTAPGFGNKAHAVAVQADGKIVVAGTAFTGTTYDFAVVRYNANGSLDTTFDGDGIATTAVTAIADARAVAIQPDGKIVVAGSAWNGSDDDFALVRYNPNGSLDTTFNGTGKVTTPVTSGDEALAVAIQPDGKIVAAGHAQAGPNFDFAVVRYNADGSLDTTFDGDGKVTTPVLSLDDVAHAVAIQADGKIVAAGTAYSPGSNFAVVRYNANGSLDSTFDGDGKAVTSVLGTDDSARSVALQPDGKIVVGGFSHNGSNQDFAVVRFNANGSLDSTFDVDGKVTTPILGGNDVAVALALHLDGRIVAGGFSHNGSNNDIAAVRYNPNGSLDTTFDGDGKVTTPVLGSDDEATSVAIQPDGRIVAAGFSDIADDDVFAVVRYGGGCAPTVTSVDPASGPTAGGNTITITGTKFTGATGVTIGGNAATSVVVVNDTTITAVTPAGSAGTASVLVTTPAGTNAANTLYTYADPPTGVNDTIFDSLRGNSHAFYIRP